MSVSQLVTWLQERTALTILPENVLSAIAQIYLFHTLIQQRPNQK